MMILYGILNINNYNMDTNIKDTNVKINKNNINPKIKVKDKDNIININRNNSLQIPKYNINYFKNEKNCIRF
ncbi:MAG: hypothetical protein WC346_03935 [Methanogenium sp.]|jgi:hypothetical protein